MTHFQATVSSFCVGGLYHAFVFHSLANVNLYPCLIIERLRNHSLKETTT